MDDSVGPKEVEGGKKTASRDHVCYQHTRKSLRNGYPRLACLPLLHTIARRPVISWAVLYVAKRYSHILFFSPA